MYHKYTGIILKKYPLNEADELLTIYTREQGKIRARAVSSRKIKSRLMGNLQTLNEIDFETARNSGNLPVVISARIRILNDFLRQNLKKFAYVQMAVETLYRLTPDEQPDREIYEALLKFLKILGEERNENLEVRKFQLELLAASGYQCQLQPENEREITQFLTNILEREIKSEQFAGMV